MLSEIARTIQADAHVLDTFTQSQTTSQHAMYQHYHQQIAQRFDTQMQMQLDTLKTMMGMYKLQPPTEQAEVVKALVDQMDRDEIAWLKIYLENRDEQKQA